MHVSLAETYADSGDIARAIARTSYETALVVLRADLTMSPAWRKPSTATRPSSSRGSEQLQSLPSER